MSPSLAADPAGSPTEISLTDIIAAVLLHLAVLAALAALQAWQARSLPLPPPSVEVRLISGAQLHKMQHKSQPAPTPVQAAPKPKPAPSLAPKPKAKPAVKPKPKPRHSPKPAVKPRPRFKKEPDFDPFAPLVSPARTAPSRHSAKAATPTPPRPTTPAPRLSQAELDRYRALIQEAVQSKWKVPASVHYTVDPVVEMELNRDGSIRRLVLAVSSGNAALDQSLLRAIEAAAPFILPPQQFDAFRHNRIRFHPLR